MSVRPPLLEVRDLTVSFDTDDGAVQAVDRVSYTVERGTALGIVGESGSGKSVSSLTVMGLTRFAGNARVSGQVLFEGRDLLAAGNEELRSLRGGEIAMIFQDPLSSLHPFYTIGDQLVEAVRVHRDVSKSQARDRAIEMLGLVGIPEPRKRIDSYPHEFSGGMRQRVMIAMGLINDPKLLIADEPTTALDVTIQAQILELLGDLQREMGMAMLLITHDLGIVRRMADRVYVMQNGEIVETGSAKAVFETPKHAYTRHLLAAEPKGTPPETNMSGPVVVETDNLKVWFPIKRGLLQRTVDHVKAVDGLSMKLRAGETLGVVGESGSGKTTLGLAILRLISSEGPIAYVGNRIDGYDSKAMRPLRKEMQVVFQDPYGSLSPRLTVGQIIEEGLLIQHPEMDEDARRGRVGKALQEVGLDPNAQDRYPHEFSGGQRQRIAIARAMVLEPKFVMLDEPTSALDMSVQAQIVDLLRDLQKKRQLAYLFISHDLKVVRALCNYVIVMRNGKVVEEGPAREIFEHPKDDYTKALLAAALDHRVAHKGALAG